MVRAVRGATTVLINDKTEIWDATEEMLNEIIKTNNLNHEDLISITFTMTKDLDACYPAVRAREMGFGDVPLMCMSELSVEGSLKRCIRVIIYVNTDKSLKEMKHVYLREAVNLRRDLIESK